MTTSVSVLGSPQGSFAVGDLVLSTEPWIWSLEWNMHKTVCAHCFKESANLRTCSSCKLYRYCDVNCQAASWKMEHKVECAMLKEVKARTKDEPDSKHNCKLLGHVGCGGFGFQTLQIMLWKIAKKIKEDRKSGNSGKHVELLNSLPRTSRPPFTANECGALWSALWNEDSEDPTVLAVWRLIQYNTLPIKDERKLRLLGAGLFPDIPHRAMTPVCWDVNVTMHFQGRRLVVLAAKEIVDCNGFRQLRSNDLMGLRGIPFGMTRNLRRDIFEAIHGFQCECRGCTAEWDAEINPLRCVTTSCTERIPSDHRAAQPCPQCGAINTRRLQQYKELLSSFEKMENEIITVERQNPGAQDKAEAEMGAKIDSTGILQADAHLRVAYGWNLAASYEGKGEFKKAWALIKELIVSVRANYPKYYATRAHCLLVAGAFPYRWFSRYLGWPDDRAQSIANRTSADALGFIKEAREIFVKLYGSDSLPARDTENFIMIYQ